MAKTRLLLVSAVLLLLALLAGAWNGRAARGSTVAQGLSVPRVGRADDASSTWFCSAAGAPGDPAPSHQLGISNTGSRVTPVRITAFGPTGVAGSHTVRVPGGSTTVVDVDATFSAAGLAAMVEAPSGSLAVTNWLLSPAMGDVVPCDRESSSVWYFPSQTTLTGSAAQLTLFNPFSSDAGVDISAAVADGIRSPTEWAGIVVPAGTTKVIDLGEHIQRRDQFALTVRVRTGRVFAATVQTFNGVAIDPNPAVTGLRIGRAVAAPRGRWTFAAGFKDAGASEALVVQNPGSVPTTVRVQVFPYGSDPALAPEPFELQVPARRYAVLDLSGEGRVPDVGFHSITLETEPTRPVVVERRIRLSAAPSADETGVIRPALAQGVSAGTGTSGAARAWIMAGVITGGGNHPLGFVHNPAARAVTVDVVSTDDRGEQVVLASKQRIAPGDSLALDLAPEALATPGSRIYRVSASAPVVVEQLVTLGSIPDFSLVPAFPDGSGN